MMSSQLLSYEDFINSPISVSRLVQQLISHGADQQKLKKLAQRAGYIYLPGTRAYYWAEFFMHLWLTLWSALFGFIFTLIILPSYYQSGQPATERIFWLVWLSVSFLISLSWIHFYHQPDYYVNYYTRGEQEYLFYTFLKNEFPDQID